MGGHFEGQHNGGFKGQSYPNQTSHDINTSKLIIKYNKWCLFLSQGLSIIISVTKGPYMNRSHSSSLAM
jgi:hypothetical protein